MSGVTFPTDHPYTARLSAKPVGFRHHIVVFACPLGEPEDMNYVAIFHANLNYAFLEDTKYEQVIRASYETIFDVFAEKFPHQRYVFEASGYTIVEMAKRTPDVLKKLIKAVESGQCEFMGSTYSHPILANVTEEEGRWSLQFANDAYKKHLGFLPTSAWNPECTWMQYVPHLFRDAGYKHLAVDFEAYMVSADKEYSWIERNRCHDMYWGGNLPQYELDPDCKFLHRPFRDIVPGLHGFCRSNRVVGGYIGYFLGRIPLEKYLETIKAWQGTDPKGATVIIADDAEYTGTTGYYYVKYHRDYSRSFNVDPQAREKLTNLLGALDKMGQLITFAEACNLEPLAEPYFCEERLSWHRTWADAWSSTPEAKKWDPIIAVMRNEYKEECQPILEADAKHRPLVEKFWFHLTNASNSDGRWPPPPAETCPFNRDWVLHEMDMARKTLAECKAAVQGLPVPAQPEPPREQEWVYGLRYTDKDTRDLTKLTYYELSHHLYASYRLYDKGEGAIKEQGRQQVNAIYDEFARRGFTHFLDRRIK